MKKNRKQTAAKFMAALLTLNSMLCVTPPYGNLTVWADTPTGYVDEIVDEDGGYDFDDDYDYDDDNYDYDYDWGSKDSGNDPASTATPSIASSLLATYSNARAVSDITIDTENKCVFANGIPIIIQTNNTITSVYNSDLVLLSGTTDITNYTIYGGWNDSENTSRTHTASTSVTVKSGTLTNVWGGGIGGTINGTTSVTIDGGSMRQVLGGSSGGKVSKTTVTFHDGTCTWVNGGGNGCTIGETKVIVSKLPTNGSSVSAGGVNSTITKAILKLDATPYTTPCLLVGSGEYDTIEEVEIQLSGKVQISNFLPIYANWAAFPPASSWNTSTVKKAAFILDGLTLPQYTNTTLPCLSGLGVTGSVTLSINITDQSSLTPHIHFDGIDTVSIKQGTAALYGCDTSVWDNTWGVNITTPSALTLKKLTLEKDSSVQFFDNASVTIDEISGSGTITFGSYQTGNTLYFPPYISVKKISSTLTTPLLFNTTGNGWDETALNNQIFFTGEGVSISSLNNVKSTITGYNAVLNNEKSSILVAPAIPTVFTKAVFTDTSYSYGSQMPIEIELQDQDGTPVSGLVTITAGSSQTKIAETTLDASGKTTLNLSVNSYLRDLGIGNRELTVYYAGDDTYQSASKTVHCSWSTQITSITITNATIDLTGNITAPALNTNPQTAFSVSENAFYTADLIWSPNTVAFEPATEYRVSIHLTPKSGFDFDSISMITYNTGEVLAFEKETASLIIPVTTYAALTAPEGGLKYSVQLNELTTLSDSLTEVFGDFTSLKNAVVTFAQTVLDTTSNHTIHTAFYDPTLLVSLDGGITWENAVKGNFPIDGIDVLLDHPDGTTSADYDFAIIQILEDGSLSTRSLEDTTDGLRCHLDRISPIAVVWTERTTDDNLPDSDHADDNYDDETEETVDSAFSDSHLPSHTDSANYGTSGWILSNTDHHWYHVNDQRTFTKGWYLDLQDGNWYYLDTTTGAMLVGWQFIDGKWYYFNALAQVATWYYDAVQRSWFYDTASSLHPYGAMFKNETTPDGYFVDENGQWGDQDR